MTESQIINALLFAFGVGVFCWLLSDKKKDGELSSFDVITMMILKERKSGKK